MTLLIAFIAIPLIEIALFIQIGGLIQLGPTLLLVVVTAILGAYLVRSQGLAKLQDIQNSFNRLEDPTEPLAHGIMILISGALLLTPGFFTDTIGFALLVPGFRTLVLKWATKRMKIKGFTGHSAGPDTIDGSFEDLDSPRPPRDQPSGWTRH